MSSIVEFSLGRQKNLKWSRGLGMLIDNKDVQGGVTKAKAVMFVGHGGSFTAEVSDSKRLRTPKVKLGLFPYVY